MKIQKFEDIIAWQKAKELTIFLYGKFSKNKDFKFRDQILSASVSIMNNIAEGFDRRSKKEFARFLTISRGSCSEVKSMLYLASEFKYISEKDFKKSYDLSVEISRLITGFIKALSTDN